MERALVKLAAWSSGLLLVLAVSGDVIAEATSTDAAEISASVESFHRALARGDRTAALTLLAPDAVILESGHSQMRTEYEREHSSEDIAFARATTTDRSPLTIQREGNVAWATSTSRTTGNCNGRQIDNAGVELMVLTKGESGWRIRAIHWSSRQFKPSK
jgi:ketosteroid isomerase-like protein